jgi:hypothetical protein
VGVEIINTVDGSVHGDDNKSGSMEDEVRDEVINTFCFVIVL